MPKSDNSYPCETGDNKAELQLLQDDFDRYVKSVSHDLNAPLRHIREFSKILLQSLDDKVSDEEREYSEIVSRAVTRLETKLTALRDYSRISIDPMKVEPVEISDLLERVAKTNEKAINKISASLTVSCPQITLNADKKLLKEVISELLSNAIRFCDSDRALALSLDAAIEKEHCIITVKDNGRGLPETAIKNVFSLFRQHHVEIKQGLGMGLPCAQRIIQRHNGIIKFESWENEGSKVTVALPMKL